ncbi:hypothetical protein BGZ72_002765 [Mortierella alpina]|nr:hypothetical protein BGZ72_002765 [Mortierella alpina]
MPAAEMDDDFINQVIRVLEEYIKNSDEQFSETARKVSRLGPAAESDSGADPSRKEDLSDMRAFVKLLSTINGAGQHPVDLSECLAQLETVNEHPNQDTQPRPTLASKADNTRIAEIVKEKEVRLVELAQMERILVAEVAQLERIRLAELAVKEKLKALQCMNDAGVRLVNTLDDRLTRTKSNNDISLEIQLLERRIKNLKARLEQSLAVGEDQNDVLRPPTQAWRDILYAEMALERIRLAALPHREKIRPAEWEHLERIRLAELAHLDRIWLAYLAHLERIRLAELIHTTKSNSKTTIMTVNNIAALLRSQEHLRDILKSEYEAQQDKGQKKKSAHASPVNGRDIHIQTLWGQASGSLETFLELLRQAHQQVIGNIHHLCSAVNQASTPDASAMDTDVPDWPSTASKRKAQQSISFFEDDMDDPPVEAPRAGKRHLTGGPLRSRHRDVVRPGGATNGTFVRPQLVRNGSRTLPQAPGRPIPRLSRSRSKTEGPLPRLTRSRSQADETAEFFMLE